MNQRQTCTSKLAMLTGMYMAASVIIYVGGTLILTTGSTYAQETVDGESQITNNQAYLNCIRTGQFVGMCYRYWRSDSSDEPWLSAEEIENWSINRSSTRADSGSARTLLEPKFFELRSLWSSTFPEHLKGFSESRI